MSLNKVILIGNVGKDPDVKYFENENAVANFMQTSVGKDYADYVAANWATANGTQIPERTDWHNIAVRKKEIVSFVERFVKKGSLVTVEGKIRYREYDKDGVRHFVTEILADRVDFFNNSSRRSDNNGANAEQNTADSQA